MVEVLGTAESERERAVLVAHALVGGLLLAAMVGLLGWKRLDAWRESQ